VPDIGSSLREERLRRGLELDEVASATLIRGRYLEALELERYDLLPEGFYRRGFLRRYAEFLGLDAADAGRAQDRSYVGGNFLPVALDLSLNVELLNPEPLGDQLRVGGVEMEEFGLEVEGISQAVGRIDAHDECAIAKGGKFDAGGGRQTGLADAALAGEHQNSHGDIVDRVIGSLGH